MLTKTRAIKLLHVARAIAQLSKDPSTKVGALIVGPAGEGGPWGYNGAPRGCSADEDERYASREEKLWWAEHAERNALYAAARAGFPTRGCAMIVTHPPCMDCARAIVQAGIKEVWCPIPDDSFVERWQEHIDRSVKLFDECGVRYEWISE